LMQDLARIGLGEPCQEVEGGSLARSVRADEAADPAAGHGEAAAVDGLNAPECLAQAARLDHDIVRRRQWTIPLRTQPRSIAKPMSPRGMNRATTMMNTP